MQRTDIAYRQTAVEGASGFGLLIALYDTLVGNLRRAAAAQRSGNIEARTGELKHALVIVGFLENWIDPQSGDLAVQLKNFYQRTRNQIIEAQARQSAAMLEEQMNEALKIREIWQQLDGRIGAPGSISGSVSAAAMSGPEILPPARPAHYGSMPPPQMEQAQLSWSA